MTSVRAPHSWRQEQHFHLPPLEEGTAAFDSNGSDERCGVPHTHKRQKDKAAVFSCQPKKKKETSDDGEAVDCGQDTAPSSTKGKARSLALRKEFIAPGCIMFYPDDPLMIVRGEGQYLFDEQGRKYLDCVNNVCHVGHCHPRVVEAGMKQMQVLSTNNRYLHDNIGSYAQHLRKKLPGDLSTFFFLNSGSEANDLALRLAREVTGGTEVIAIDGAYHGNLTSLMSISSYKWGGDKRWCGEHTLLAPLPDVYRGKYRDPETAGQLYAEEVKKLIDQAHSKGKKIAGFIAESAMSSAGQVIFPKGYLQAVYRYVREAGGLCIADEVQVGFGRAGKNFWMFENHGVLPDVVTIGKPMGNGHPVAGLVTTAKIAKEHSVVAPSFFNTYGGNPVSMAIAEATLCVIEDEHLQEHAERVGGFLLAELEALKAKHPQVIGDVRGDGLFGCVELVKSPTSREPNSELAKAIHQCLMRKFRIIMTTDGMDCNALKYKPPMTFTTEDAKYLCESLDAALTELAAAPLPGS